ncbi:MAG TPA: sugar phosphate isomerase/epimerase family protein [Gaiellaceae bacterium]|nr:sugar phosphate isomerase/epimerase family protein [Gaiellaceae bacterium]
MSNPRYSISQITTLGASFAEDLAAYSSAGFAGVGIWELKLPEGGDGAALEALAASGLEPASAVPTIPSILPLPLLGGPDDPAERMDSLAASIHRLAAFGAPGIVCLTGTAEGRDRDDARATVVDGLRTLAHEAELAGTRIALEPYQADGGALWTIAGSIPEALELIEEAGGSPALGLQFDVWHLWNTPELASDIPAAIDRIAGVHVADVRAETRGWADRVLPGDGIAEVPAILAALDSAGWSGLYDLEIFSDDGTFGASYPDSLWNVSAAELAGRARRSLDAAWARRPAAVSTHQSKNKEDE